ncbi:MAG: redoxin domain-containing protein, partial [Pirellulales bacterium]
MRTRASALVALLALCAAPLVAEESKAPIGKKIDNFTLNDFHGQPYSLDQVGKDKFVVLTFLGTECPLCKIYAPRLMELAKQYEPQGVVFLGIDPNRQDAVTEIAAYARVHEIAFPILKDLKQGLADQLGVTRTPEVVVLDKNRTIRYRGRIDDQYGIKQNMNYQLTEPKQRDLVSALDAVLAGKPVAQAEVAAAGCLIGRDLEPVVDSDVTYSKQIARIMNDNCVFCHRDGQIAPFTLTSYD